jgi:hypothetical protein
VLLFITSVAACNIFQFNPDTETIEVDESKLAKKEPNYKNDYFSMYLAEGWEEGNIKKGSSFQNVTISFSHSQTKPRKGNMIFNIYVDYCNNSGTGEVTQQDLVDEFEKRIPTAKRITDYKISGITFSRFKQYDLDEKKYKYPIVHIGIIGDDDIALAVFESCTELIKAVFSYKFRFNAKIITNSFGEFHINTGQFPLFINVKEGPPIIRCHQNSQFSRFNDPFKSGKICCKNT